MDAEGARSVLAERAVQLDPCGVGVREDRDAQPDRRIRAHPGELDVDQIAPRPFRANLRAVSAQESDQRRFVDRPGLGAQVDPLAERRAKSHSTRREVARVALERLDDAPRITGLREAEARRAAAATGEPEQGDDARGGEADGRHGTGSLGTHGPSVYQRRRARCQFAAVRRLVASIFALGALTGLAARSDVGSVAAIERVAHADASPPPERRGAFAVTADVTLVTSAALALVLPRLLHGDGHDSVAGWSPRWHLTALAPALLVGGAATLNELWLKDAIASRRPGCDASNVGVAGCTSYGGPSTRGIVLGAAFGYGLGLLTTDAYRAGETPPTIAWVTHLVVPFALTALGAGARIASREESASQVLGGTALGLALGLASGVALAYFTPATCGYEGGVVCW